jgi:hypothetical protein
MYSSLIQTCNDSWFTAMSLYDLCNWKFSYGLKIMVCLKMWFMASRIFKEVIFKWCTNTKYQQEMCYCNQVLKHRIQSCTLTMWPDGTPDLWCSLLGKTGEGGGTDSGKQQSTVTGTLTIHAPSSSDELLVSPTSLSKQRFISGNLVDKMCPYVGVL